MECDQCRLKFKTPPVLEPRKFKCRSCGNIFIVEPPEISPPKKADLKKHDSDADVVTLETDPGMAIVPDKNLGSAIDDPCAMTYPARDGQKIPPPLSMPGKAAAPPIKPFRPSQIDVNSVKIPGYEMISRVGSGGMGVVFRARQKSLDRDVAIKVLSPELAQMPKFLARFSKEAKALSQLNHPGIVGVIDRGQVDAVCYLVMEYIAGTTLRYLLQKVQMTLRQFLDVVLQILDALEYIHSKNIVHRDIKPENIIITKNRRIKLADFGLACLLDPDSGNQQLTRQHSSLGTVNYMAPEQRLNAAAVDHRADIYSLGVILYEIVTGEIPMGAFDPPSRINKRLSRRLDAIIIKALKARADERYQSAGQMKDDIDAYISSVRRKPPKMAKEEEEKPISRIRMAPGKSSHTKIPSPSPGYDAEEERRMWEVWQEHQKEVNKSRNDRRPRPAVRIGSTVKRKVTVPARKNTAPAFYERALENELALEAKREARKSKLRLSYIGPFAVMGLLAIVVGAIASSYFPFLLHIPLLGSVFAKVNIFLYGIFF